MKTTTNATAPIRNWFLRVSKGSSSIAIPPFSTACLAMIISNTTHRFQTAPQAIKELLRNLPADFKYEPSLVVADGDYVTIHGRYIGWGPKPMVAVDIFRVASGKI